MSEEEFSQITQSTTAEKVGKIVFKDKFQGKFLNQSAEIKDNSDSPVRNLLEEIADKK